MNMLAGRSANTMAGFTIVELLIVIVVIGILLTIGVASPIGFLISSRNSERADDVSSIARLLEQDYTNQTAGSPSYPAQNTFVADTKTQTGTAQGADQNIFEAPGASVSSVMAATTTDSQTPNGSGSPLLNQYFYQALTSNGQLCQDHSQTCVSYRLFYRSEGDNVIHVTASLHQQ